MFDYFVTRERRAVVRGETNSVWEWSAGEWRNRAAAEIYEEG